MRVRELMRRLEHYADRENENEWYEVLVENEILIISKVSVTEEIKLDD